MSQKLFNKETAGNQADSENSKNNTDLDAIPKNEQELDKEANPKIEPKSFLEKWEHHRFLFFRATYTIFNTVWIVVMAVGGFIAWLIAMIAL